MIMNKNNNLIPLYIVLLCIFLTLISIYYEDQKKAAILGHNNSSEHIDE